MTNPNLLHPGEVLVNELDGRNEEVTAFAIKMGLFPSDFIDLLNGKQHMTPAIAQSLEKALNIPAKFWLDLQADYDAEVRK